MSWPKVSSFKFQVSSFKFQVSSFKFQVYRIVPMELLNGEVLRPTCDFIDNKVMLFLFKYFGE
ncbi:hypothetical protein SynPROSU1_02380 [Synechococcus sp. PROS-U-1]|nr:hypothetical protein SynPROSU1_02380 [Synechococcus sp. PROS-U-1]